MKLRNLPCARAFLPDISLEPRLAVEAWLRRRAGRRRAAQSIVAVDPKQFAIGLPTNRQHVARGVRRFLGESVRVSIVLFVGVSGPSIVLAQNAPSVRLTLKHAIELALTNNVGVLMARSDVDEAAGTRVRRRATLLPHTTVDALVNRQNRNLAAVGLSIPNVPTVVGPYSFMDFRVSASQAVIDREAYHEWKASTNAEASTRLTYQDVRDLVIRQVAGLYLASQSAAAEVEAADERVTTSRSLEQLARDQRDQSLATGVDVLRAQVQLERDRHNALVARNAYQTSLLALARFLGLDLAQSLELAEPLAFETVTTVPVEDMLHGALAARADYQALVAERSALEEQREASHARVLPKVSIAGDYGRLGSNFGELPGIGEIQATVALNLFDRDRVGAEAEADARLQRLIEQMADIARGIEQELRTAALDLESAEQQVQVAEAAVELATRELALAEDRFRNGVTDNIEVIAAQDALAETRDERIAALARHADARAALARARGLTERTFLGPGGEP